VHERLQREPLVRAGVARPMHSARHMDTDFTALLIAFGFFAASWGFVALCERLRS
jgi:hypothetical protein